MAEKPPTPPRPLRPGGGLRRGRRLPRVTGVRVGHRPRPRRERRRLDLLAMLARPHRATSPARRPRPRRPTARGPRKRDVLVQGVDAERAGVAVHGGVELADEAVAVEDRQREVAPPPSGPGLVHLQRVLVVEELAEADPVVHQAVERGQQRRASADGAPTAAGSTRHSPAVPATTAGSPACPTIAGPGDAEAAQPPLVLLGLCRRRRHRGRVPSGYTRSARSHTRWRPWRREIAISPRAARNSSIWVTLRSLVQPVDGHDTSLRSGTSRDSNGPKSRSTSSTKRRNRSLAASQSWALVQSSPGQSCIWARYSGRSDIGRTKRPVLEHRALDLQRGAEVGLQMRSVPPGGSTRPGRRSVPPPRWDRSAGT